MNLNIIEEANKILNKADKKTQVEQEYEVNIFTTWDDEIVSGLIHQEHERKSNIKNMSKYLDLDRVNRERWQIINDAIYDMYGVQGNKEVLKEISFEVLCKTKKTNEIIELMKEYDQI